MEMGDVGAGTKDQTGRYSNRRKHPPYPHGMEAETGGAGARLQLAGVEMTRETLVKIERGIQHITATQLRGIRDVLETTYDELLKESP